MPSKYLQSQHIAAQHLWRALYFRPPSKISPLNVINLIHLDSKFNAVCTLIWIYLGINDTNR